MKVKLTHYRTLDGRSYPPGEHTVDEKTGRKLLHNFPRVCFEPSGVVIADAVELEGNQTAGGVVPTVDVDAILKHSEPIISTTVMVKDGLAVRTIQEAEKQRQKADVASATDSAVALADELGVDLTQVIGTGKDGKILVKDVRAAAE